MINVAIGEKCIGAIEVRDHVDSGDCKPRHSCVNHVSPYMQLPLTFPRIPSLAFGNTTVKLVQGRARPLF